MNEKPKLRSVEGTWAEHRGQPVVVLRDPLGLSDKTLLVPASLSLLLALCDGSRDLATLGSAFHLRTGTYLSPRQLLDIVGQLDEALLLDSARYREGRAAALAKFRQAPHRSPALAGRGYPSDPEELRRLLDDFVVQAFGTAAATAPADGVCGLISPHIDFHRGGTVYARAWLPVAEALRTAELVVLLGTDHAGLPGQITATRQNYATPFGVIPTAQTVVEALASSLGEESVFEGELDHRHEHSIELAAVWLHYLWGDHPCELAPILCGSFHSFLEDDADLDGDPRINAALDALQSAIEGRNAIVVAAADLAHVGPAFGDSTPFGVAEREQLRRADAELLGKACTGSASAFFAPVRKERDRRRICGVAPIYYLLRLLEGTRGEVTGYAQCPADPEGGSWVSIAGVVYHRD